MSTRTSSASLASTNTHQDASSIQLPPSMSQLRRTERGRIMFPLRLHTMLRDAEIIGCSHVICWQPHGRCFVVLKPDEFVSRFAPMYFRQSKWSSFQRQLNIYGFIRLTDGPDKGGYYHLSFLRGHPSMCDLITRTTVKGTLVRAATNPTREPDFYAMPSLDSVSGTNLAACAETWSLDDNPVSKAIQTCSGDMSAASVPNWGMHIPQRYDGHILPCCHHAMIQSQSALHTMAYVTDNIADHRSWSGHGPTVFRHCNMAQIVPTLSFCMSMQQMSGLQAGFLAQPDSVMLKSFVLSDDSPDDSRMLSDDPNQLQSIFASEGDSFNFDELDELPEGDKEWWDLLESDVS